MTATAANAVHPIDQLREELGRVLKAKGHLRLVWSEFADEMDLTGHTWISKYHHVLPAQRDQGLVKRWLSGGKLITLADHKLRAAISKAGQAAQGIAEYLSYAMGDQAGVWETQLNTRLVDLCRDLEPHRPGDVIDAAGECLVGFDKYQMPPPVVRGRYESLRAVLDEHWQRRTVTGLLDDLDCLAVRRGSKKEPPKGETTGVQRALGKLATVAESADWSMREMARQVGCHHSTLSRDQRFMAARGEAQKSRCLNIPNGFKDNRTGNLDADGS